MADSEQTLKLLIELGVIGQQDARAAKQLMDEMGDSQKNLNQSMPENLQNLASGWAGWDKYKTSMGGAGEGAEHLHGKLRELQKVLRIGGPETAEIGHLLHFLTNPAMLAGAAIAGGMEAYFHWVEKANDEHKKTNEMLQKHVDFQREIVKLGGNVFEDAEKIGKAIAEARAQLGGLAEEMRRFEEISRNFDINAADAQKERVRARGEELTILEEQLGLLEQMGKINNVQATQEKLLIDHKKKQEEITASLTTKEGEYSRAVNNYQEELRRVGGAGAFSPEAIGEAQRKALDAQHALDQANALAGQKGADEKKAIQDQIRENRELWDKHGPEWDPSTGQLKGVGYRKTDEELHARLSALEKQIAGAQGNLPGLQQSAADANAHLSAVQGLHTKFSGIESNLTKMKQELDDLAATVGPKQSEEQQRYAIAAIKALLESTGQKPGDIFSKGVASMAELDFMKRDTGKSPAEWMATGNEKQKAYVAGLSKDVENLRLLEDAAGNNGYNAVAVINRALISQQSISGAHETIVKWAQDLNTKFTELKQKLDAMR